MGWSAAAMVVGSYLQGEASKDSANALASSADQQAAVQQYIYNKTRKDYAPWRNKGKRALGEMNRMLFNQDYDISTTPDYQWRLQQGIGALDASAAARNNLFSGAQLKAITDYGQNQAAAEYNNRFNRLASMAGLGQTAVQGIAGAGQNYASGMGNAYQNMGQARASGYLGQANAYSNLLNQGAYGYGMYNMFNNNAANGGMNAGLVAGSMY